MKVYALIKDYNNEVDSWDTIRDLYQSEYAAELECERLTKENVNSCVTFYVKEMEVK